MSVLVGGGRGGTEGSVGGGGRKDMHRDGRHRQGEGAGKATGGRGEQAWRCYVLVVK